MPELVLSASRRRTLAALCHTIVPAASRSPTPVDLPRAVAERVGTWDARRRREFPLLLAIIDSPVVSLMLGGGPRRFSRRSPASRAAWLATWERSRLPVRRTIFQALRRTILSTCYAMPAAREEIGHHGPLHQREPAVSWEGPLTVPVDDPGPVATGERGRTRANERDRPGSPLIAFDRPRSPGRGGVERCEVCVVGSGPGGAVAACRLAEAGRDVVILEAGGHWPTSSFDEDEATQMPRLYAEQANRSTDDLSIPIFQGACVGGGSTVNWMIMLRTPEHVLEEWRDRHGVEGMDPDTMRGAFERIEDEVHARFVPPEAHNPNNRIILDGAAALGWQARRARINAKDCIRAGTCGLGCRYGAKQSALVTHLPRAVAAGARLYAHARVHHVERRNGRWRVHLLPSSPDRGVDVVGAETVVLSAGAVGSPAILQRSGLGGSAVGRFLRLHPTTAVGGFFAHEIYAAAGIPQSAYCDHFLQANDGYGFWIEGPPVQPGLASIALPGFGDANRDLMTSYRHLGVLIALVRDGADRGRSNGRVSVGRRGRVHIRYRLRRAEHAMLSQAIDASLRMLLAAGAREAFSLHLGAPRVRVPDDVAAIAALPAGPNQIGLFSAHPNGTCRIGTDPATSVCVPDAQVRGAPGLYVCDGSLMPTAPGVNPQETIMAMASVIGDRLADHLRPASASSA